MEFFGKVQIFFYIKHILIDSFEQQPDRTTRTCRKRLARSVQSSVQFDQVKQALYASSLIEQSITFTNFAYPTTNQTI